MRTLSHISALTLLSLTLLSRPSRADTPAPPAPDDAQKLFDTGQFADALKTARRALAITGTAGAAYDRQALYMLAAESCLHLKQSSTALDLLKVAQKENEKNDQTANAQLNLAFITLIQNSPNNTYVSNAGGSSNKFDILDTTTRHQSYEALFTDQKSHCDARIQSAQQTTSLTPIIEVAKLYTVTRAVELAASGNTKRSDTLAQQAERWAGNLIGNTEDGFEQRISRIQIDSNVNALGRIRPRRPAAISDPDIATLHQIIADCQKIPDAIKIFTTAFAKQDIMAHQLARSKDLADRANETLQQNARVGNGKS